MRSASVNYRTAVAYLEGSVEQAGDSGRATGTIDGSIVAAGGGIFMANRVDDGFAVVKAGGPDIDVSLNGRRVVGSDDLSAESESSGKSARVLKGSPSGQPRQWIQERNGPPPP